MIFARRSRTVLVVAALAGLGSVHSSPARADDTASGPDPATLAMFKRAMSLVAQKHFAEACPDLEEVARRLPNGLGAKVALAECREGEGRLATAWTRWSQAQEAARVAKQPESEATSKARADKLEPRLSRLTITVPNDIAAIPGLVVHYDTLPVTRSEWGLTFPVDGGPHFITATAPKKREWRKDLSIAKEGAKVVVAIPMLEDAPVDPLPPPVVAVQAPPPAPAPTPLNTPAINVNAGAVNVTTPQGGAPTASHGVPGWAWGVGAVGLGLMGGAVAFRLDQSSVGSTIDAKCPLPGRTGCNAGYDFRSDHAREVRDFDLFLGLGIGGIVAVGASVIGIVTATSSKPAAPPVAWTILPATLPNHAAGVAYTTSW